jgi:uncharacterized protein (DUF697 family)
VSQRRSGCFWHTAFVAEVAAVVAVVYTVLRAAHMFPKLGDAYGSTWGAKEGRSLATLLVVRDGVPR